MAPNEEEKIEDFVRRAAEAELGRHWMVLAFPSSGMSFANVYGLLRFIEKGSEQE